MKTNSNEVFRKFMDEEDFLRIKEYSTVSEMWNNCLKEYSDLNAISDNGVTKTYAELESDVKRVRGYLSGLGLKTGDRVGVFYKNSYDLVVAYLGVVTSGVCACVLPAHLDDKSLYGCTRMFGLKALLYGEDQEEKMGLVKTLGVPVHTGNFDCEGKDVCTTVTGKDACVIMFTGGTTGKSKGALLSNKAVMTGTINGCYGTKSIFNNRYLLVLPLSHVFGLIRNLMTCLYTGSCMYICRNNKDMFRDIAMCRPTVLVVVPAIVELALNLSKQFGKNMLGDSLKYVICGAAAVSPYLIKECAKIGITLLPGYGLTESANLVSGNPLALEKPDSVGLFYGNQEYKIVDGELYLKGDNMMDGYVSMGDDNALAYEDGWFKTGDLVRVDEDGFLYITGRSKEIIVLSTGENVSPQELEAKFNTLSTVQDSQVFEDVDETGKHFLSLEVVPRMTEVKRLGIENPAQYITEQLNQINATLLPFERVEKIVIRDKDFDRTPSMKIARYHKC